MTAIRELEAQTPSTTEEVEEVEQQQLLVAAHLAIQKSRSPRVAREPPDQESPAVCGALNPSHRRVDRQRPPRARSVSASRAVMSLSMRNQKVDLAAVEAASRAEGAVEEATMTKEAQPRQPLAVIAAIAIVIGTAKREKKSVASVDEEGVTTLRAAGRKRHQRLREGTGARLGLQGVQGETMVMRKRVAKRNRGRDARGLRIATMMMRGGPISLERVRGGGIDDGKETGWRRAGHGGRWPSSALV